MLEIKAFTRDDSLQVAWRDSRPRDHGWLLKRRAAKQFAKKETIAMAIQRGKIKKAPCREIVDYLIRPGIEGDLKRSYQTILDINKAHVLMLAKQGIITREVEKKILRVNQDTAAQQADPQFEIIPDVEDLYFNFERYLIKQTSLEVGGQQHTARSRNDLFATENRIDTRRFFIDTSRRFIRLRRALLAWAKENKDAVMSGYTHLQPSEPITLAHYCSAVLAALGRDYRRFAAAWDTINRCPLGGGSMGSTTWPIDRDYTAKLLGFDGPVENSLDCVASRDFALELGAAMAMAAVTMSRTAMDMYLWATPEYGYIEVDDSCAVCSSIMPQKKNPITLEHVKSKASHLEAYFISCWGAMKNVPYMHCRDISTETIRYLWTAFHEFNAELDLLAVTYPGIKVNKSRMVESAKKNFCTVTELANYLVRTDGISFREAHTIVADVVGYMQEKGLRADQITVEEINGFCEKLYGFTTRMTQEDVARALDPVRNAESKVVKGGSAPDEVTRQLTLIEQQIDSDEAALDRREKQVKDAKAALEAAVESEIAG